MNQKSRFPRSRRGAAAAALAMLWLPDCGGGATDNTEIRGSTGSENDGDAAGTAEGSSDGSIRRPQGWTEATHGKTSPNYDLLFSTDEVHSIDIVIAAVDYQAMQDDLKSLFGDSGGGMVAGGGMVVPGGDGGFGSMPSSDQMAASCAGLAVNDPCQASYPQAGKGTCQSMMGQVLCMPRGALGGGPMPGGGEGMAAGGQGMPAAAVGSTSRDPIYVPVEVHQDGHTWSYVGMRYKGNSSLMSSYSSGNGKVPFRLNFNKYDAEHPEIDGQRFYGFKELTFGSNWSDNSQLREVFAGELLRDRGIPAARSAFYRATVDAGDGPVYWGLYTMTEDPADGAMLDAQLGGHDGNLYKPEGTGADWTVFNKDGFAKKNNEDAADWSDIEGAVNALLTDQSDAAAWRKGLEAKFNVDAFLRWLAVNTAMQNWDSYGQMAHNYYLYVDPHDDGRIRWIPWDHNLSMMDQSGAALGGGDLAREGGAVPAMPPEDAGADGSRVADAGGSASPDAGEAVPFEAGAAVPVAGVTQNAYAEIFHTSAGTAWPLISRTLADPTYMKRYRELLKDALGGLFQTDQAAARLHELHDLIEPHVIGKNGESAGRTTISSEDAFKQSIDGDSGLIKHITSRQALVQEALAK